MVEVAPVADEADEQLSLDAYLETWPHESYGLPEVRAFKASLLDHADLLAREDGAVLGCGFVALFPGLPESPRVMLTVPPRNRGRGAHQGKQEPLGSLPVDRHRSGEEPDSKDGQIAAKRHHA